MQILTKLKWCFDRVVGFAALLSCALYIFIMLAVTLSVVMRYLIKAPVTWVPEITSYALLYLTFLGASWLLRREGHVCMDFVLNSFNPRVQNMIEGITSFFCAVMFLILAFYGILVTVDHFRNAQYDSISVLKTPDAFYLGVIPIGCLLLFVQAIIRGRSFLQRMGKEPPVGQSRSSSDS